MAIVGARIGELGKGELVEDTVNAWNRIGVTTRAWLPGSYTP